MNEEVLFAAALERTSAAERGAFLDAACGGDPGLRHRVEQLLAADEHARGILDQGAAALLAICRPDRPLGEALRRSLEVDPPGYELSEKVGEGGMGVVYRARDTALDRDVAVKVLRLGLAADGPIVARFLGEARVTARLQHPGVPPVHQVGELADGRPFLVMKLIQGQTLADRLAAGPADRGPLVAAFEHVCQAVAYAHSRGVVHRDLKPQNVMVGEFGEVQVMDWGLAKVLGPAADRGRPAADGEAGAPASAIDSGRQAEDDTRTGSVLGTPAYMPPEQAIGAVDQIDERSDVFGLGAILCAILTGKPPYVGADSESTRQLAARGRLTDAFTRLGECGADPGLVALCQRCLAAEKADRPADGGQVAKAVAELRAAADERARQAELDRVRVEGERAKAEAEAREQRKRRRAQLALATAVGLFLVIGGAFGWHADRQAAGRDRDERARRDRTAEAVAALLDESEAALRADQADRAAVALGAADRRAADGGAEELADRLAACRADLALLRELNAIDTFRWTQASQDFPDSKAVAARWRAALAGYGLRPEEDPAEEAAGRVNGSLVRDRILAALDAWLAFDRSAGVRAVLRAVDPDPYREPVRDALTASNTRLLGTLARQPAALGQPARFAAVLGELNGVPADQGRAMLESALRARPGDLSLLMALGNSYPMKGPDGADERVRWFQAAVAAHPGNLAARNNLGNALRVRGDVPGAIAILTEILRLDPGFARAHVSLGEARLAKGDRAGAAASIREAIRLDPKDAYAHYSLGLALRAWDRDGAIASFKEAARLNPIFQVAHYELGEALRAKGEWEAAVASFRETIRLIPNFAAAHFGLGQALWAKGDLAGAIAAYREAVRLKPSLAPAHVGLRDALWATGDLAGAVAAHQEMVRFGPQDAGARNAPLAKGDLRGSLTEFLEAVRVDPKDARGHYALGFALRNRGDLTGALASFQEVVRLDPNFVPGHIALGDVLWDKGNRPGAVASYKEAVRVRPDFAPAQFSLGEALRGTRDLAGAVAAYRAATRADPTFAAAHTGLGDALRAKGDWAGAVASYREAVRLRPDFAPPFVSLGNALRVTGDSAGAIAACREAIRVHPGFAGAHVGLGDALLQNGDLGGAVANFKEAVRFDPKYARAHNQLAWLLATGPDGMRDGPSAVQHATEACKLTEWKMASYLDTLAAAYAATGDFDRAVAFERRALDSKVFQKEDGQGVRKRLDLYLNKKPYRDPDLVPREAGPPPREVKP